MRIVRMLTLLLAAAVALAGAARAQTYSVFDVGKRTQISLNAGGMVFYEEQTGAEGWRGVSAGGALTYSLHPRLSLFGFYDHGFPISSTFGHENVLGAAANLKAYPLPGEPRSATQLFLGGGYVAFDQGSTSDWRGYEAHLTLSRQFKDGWGIFGKYLVGFSARDEDPRINMGKIGLQHRLLGAK